MPQAYIMERSFGTVATCSTLQSAYDAHGWPHGISLETLKTIDKRLKKSVFLRPDEGLDTWTPLTRTVLEGKRRPAADCDDVAVTGAQLAVCAGFPADDLGLMVTQLSSRSNEFHVVSFFKDRAGSVWIFGDTMGRVRPFADLGQKAHYFAFFDDVTQWWVLQHPETGARLTGNVPTSSIPQSPSALDEIRRQTATCPHLHVPDGN